MVLVFTGRAGGKGMLVEHTTDFLRFYRLPDFLSLLTFKWSLCMWAEPSLQVSPRVTPSLQATKPLTLSPPIFYTCGTPQGRLSAQKCSTTSYWWHLPKRGWFKSTSQGWSELVTDVLRTCPKWEAFGWSNSCAVGISCQRLLGKKETTTTIPQNLLSDSGSCPTSNSDILVNSEVLPFLTWISISYFAWSLFLVRKPFRLERTIKISYLFLPITHFSLSSPVALPAGHTSVLPCPVTASPENLYFLPKCSPMYLRLKLSIHPINIRKTLWKY